MANLITYLPRQMPTLGGDQLYLQQELAAISNALGTLARTLGPLLAGQPGSPNGDTFGTGSGLALEGSSLVVRTGAFAVHRNGTAQTGLTAATDARVDWTTAQANHDAWFNLGNGRFRPQASGLYFFSLSVDTPVPEAAGPRAALFKNGTKVLEAPLTGDGLPTSALSGALVLNGTSDFVEAHVLMPAGVTTVNGTATVTNFQGFRIGAL